MAPLLAYFGMPGPLEMMIIAGIALLLFGNRLPSVMRSLGKGIVEFKKGVKGIEDDVDSTVDHSEKISREGNGSSKEKETANS
jgi:sec-independent protein translocase protein TatA